MKNKPSVPWLTNIIQLKTKLENEIVWNAYKSSRNRVTDALREAKKVKHDPKQAWKTVNKILNRKQKCPEWRNI